MSKNHMIKVVVTKQQKERIKQIAESNGYVTISAFIRDIALRGDFHIKFNHLYRILTKNEHTKLDTKT